MDPFAPDPGGSTPQGHTAQHLVGASDTARAVGSGDLDVLSTPRLIEWCEAATHTLASSIVDPGRSTVGTRVEFAHERPTPVGARVLATARLVERDGRRLVFEVIAEHDVGEGPVPVAHGRITRVDVDPVSFLGRIPPVKTRM